MPSKNMMRAYIFYVAALLKYCKAAITLALTHCPLSIIVIWQLLFLMSCKNNRPARVVERGFYYWKSHLEPGSTELKAMADLHVDRLYVKYFDVSWNAAKNAPMPLAVVTLPQYSAERSYHIIPTVFITNDCIKRIGEARIKDFAVRIVVLIDDITRRNNLKTLPEIQIDCDWNIATKDKYFLLLEDIKNLITPQRKILSATIRLHQYKYANKTGVPPVDRGLLMCYNMGNLKDPNTRNSILEPEELQKYLTGRATYPLPLDLALPIFSWKVLFKGKKYAGLITELSTKLLQRNINIKRSANKYQLLEPATLSGYQFEPGDMIRDETVSYRDLLKAESLLYKEMKTQHFSLVLYHLDSITLSKFSTNELETVFDYLH